MSILSLIWLREYGADTAKLSIESITYILKCGCLKDKDEEWGMIFLSGLKRITDQECDKPRSVTLEKLKEQKLKQLKIFKEILSLKDQKNIERKFQESINLEELIKIIETQIKSWNFWHEDLNKIKIDIPRARFGLKVSKVCHCGNYRPCSTKGLINLNCANCGGTQPQKRYRSSKK